MGIGSDLQEASVFQQERSGKKPRKPEKTAEQLALERRQSAELDKEIAKGEQRAKLAARGRLGAQSLLSGADSTQEGIVTQGGVSGRRTGGLLGGLGGGVSGGGAAPASRTTTTTAPKTRGFTR